MMMVKKHSLISIMVKMSFVVQKIAAVGRMMKKNAVAQTSSKAMATVVQREVPGLIGERNVA